MINKIQRALDLFLAKLGYERVVAETKPIDPKSQNYTDIFNINYLSTATVKITNLSCDEATFYIDSDSTLTDGLKENCKNLQDNRFLIVSYSLMSGECFVFPSYDESGKLYHSYLPKERVAIVKQQGGNIYKAFAVLDMYRKSVISNTYYLLRCHELDKDGNLIITYKVITETGNETKLDMWSYLTEKEPDVYYGANHIGFGRYKSPVNSRGLSPIYGVPLNFGCGEIEKSLFETLKGIEKEFQVNKPWLFADPRNLSIAQDDIKGGRFKIPDEITPLRMTDGITNQVALFSNAIRESSFYNDYHEKLIMLENQMGLSRGIFTENQSMLSGTATAVRRSNADTIAFINSVHNMLDVGNVQTLEADGIYTNVRRELWEYRADYFDPFADSSEQWNILTTAYTNGAVSRERLIEWIYPNMTEEQIAEELQKVDSYKAVTAQSAIRAALEM